MQSAESVLTNTLRTILAEGHWLPSREMRRRLGGMSPREQPNRRWSLRQKAVQQAQLLPLGLKSSCMPARMVPHSYRKLLVSQVLKAAPCCS